MLMRSGFFTRPRPLVEFDCGSQSTSSVLTSAAASEAARLMAVVVLPTPPFWLATAMTRPMILFLCVARRICERVCEINARLWCKSRRVFHVEHSNLFFQPRRVGRPNSVRAMFHVKHFATLRVCGMKVRAAIFAIGEVFRSWLVSHNEIDISYFPLAPNFRRIDSSEISQGKELLALLSHFTHVYQSTTLLYVIAGWVLVGAISGWLRLLGGGVGRVLFVGAGGV